MNDKELAKKAAQSVVEHGSVSLATLKESIVIKDKIDELLSKEIEMPEIEYPEMPEYPTEMVVSNLPEVQKVEIINLPEDKDDTETNNLLKTLIEEVKKKEEYEYDIKIDDALKAELKGADGKDGINGIDGIDGNEIEGSEIIDKINSLSTADESLKIDARHIKNLPEMRSGGGYFTQTTGGGSGASAFTALTDVPSSYASQGGKAIRVNAGETGLEFFTASGSGDVTGPASSTDNAIARFDSTTGKIIQNSTVTISDTGIIDTTQSGTQMRFQGNSMLISSTNGSGFVQTNFGGKVFDFKDSSGTSTTSIALDTGNITAGTYNGNTIGAGSTSGTNTGDQVLTEVEVDLGSTPRKSGKFNITGSGLVTGKAVAISQANGPYTGKGTRSDEAEMDGLIISGKVTSATNIECFWRSATRVKSNFKFNYQVSP